MRAAGSAVRSGPVSGRDNYLRPNQPHFRSNVPVTRSCSSPNQRDFLSPGERGHTSLTSSRNSSFSPCSSRGGSSRNGRRLAPSSGSRPRPSSTGGITRSSPGLSSKDDKFADGRHLDGRQVLIKSNWASAGSLTGKAVNNVLVKTPYMFFHSRAEEIGYNNASKELVDGASYDVVIVGCTEEGLACAERAARYGVSVAIVEPYKALQNCAFEAFLKNTLPALQVKRNSWESLQDAREAEAGRIRAAMVGLKDLGVALIRGEVRFLPPVMSEEVEVEAREGTRTPVDGARSPRSPRHILPSPRLSMQQTPTAEAIWQQQFSPRLGMQTPTRSPHNTPRSSRSQPGAPRTPRSAYNCAGKWSQLCAPLKVVVEGPNGEILIGAWHAIIATGVMTGPPREFEGLEHISRPEDMLDFPKKKIGDHYDTQTLTTASSGSTVSSGNAGRSRPERVAVLGDGPRAAELCALYESFGCEPIWLPSAAGRPMPGTAPLLTAELLSRMRRRGVKIVESFPARRIAPSADGRLSVIPASEMAGASVTGLDQVILVEETRAAPPKGIEMHCKLDDGGYILVDRNGTASMQVMALGHAARTAPHGEVKAPGQVISPDEQGRRIADFLFGMKLRDTVALPIAPALAVDIIWSSPPVGAVGLSAEEAKKAFGREPRALVSQHVAPGGALLMILAICMCEDDSVVGLAAIGNGVQTLLLGLAVAVHSGLKRTALEGVLSAFVSTPLTLAEELQPPVKLKSRQVRSDVDEWALKVKKQLDERHPGVYM